MVRRLLLPKIVELYFLSINVELLKCPCTHYLGMLNAHFWHGTNVENFLFSSLATELSVTRTMQYMIQSNKCQVQDLHIGAVGQFQFAFFFTEVILNFCWYCKDLWIFNKLSVRTVEPLQCLLKSMCHTSLANLFKCPLYTLFSYIEWGKGHLILLLHRSWQKIKMADPVAKL